MHKDITVHLSAMGVYPSPHCFCVYPVTIVIILNIATRNSAPRISYRLDVDVRSRGVDILKILGSMLEIVLNISNEIPLGIMNWTFNDSTPLQEAHSIMKPNEHKLE